MIKVNRKKVDFKYQLQSGDEIQIFISDELLNKNKVELQDVYDLSYYFLKILYEDDQIIAVYKPNGIIVHEDDKEKLWVLQNFIISYLIDKGEYNPKIHKFKPSPVHRIDRNTEGIVVFAKTFESHHFISDLFKKHKMGKYYYALVYGKITEKRELNYRIRKDEAKKQVFIDQSGVRTSTEIFPVAWNENFSFVKIKLNTGKMHQIRISLAETGHPILGDDKYGEKQKNKESLRGFSIDGQMLFSLELIFPEIDVSGFEKLSKLSIKECKPYNLIQILGKFGFKLPENQE